MKPAQTCRNTLLLCAASICLPAPAWGQSDPQPSADAQSRTQTTSNHENHAATHIDSDHALSDEQIIVSADYVKNLNVVSGQSVLLGDELLRARRGQLGDTLTSQPGVSATSFSPGASRPILRGFQGERVRILTDGLGSQDVSNTSADHGVSIDPLTAERIEILRGPAVLLYGSQAIGGAVYVIDRRIPRAAPENGAHLDAIAGYGSAAQDASIGLAADLSLGAGFVAHIDANYLTSSDLEVAGFILSPQLREEQLAIAAEETEEGHLDEAQEALDLANLDGAIPNSATETYSLGGGLAWIGDDANLGFSFGYFDSLYGVPSRPGAEHHHEEQDGAEQEEEGEEAVTIALKQWRGDLRGEYELGDGFFESLRLRSAFSQYDHTEFEGAEIGTVFSSNAWESRLELVQANRNGWRGVIGAQGLTRDFEAIGEEAFVPPNSTTQLGLFTLQEFEVGAIEVELAARYEHSSVRGDAVRIGLDSAETTAIDRQFNSLSGAVGLSYTLQDRLQFGLSASRAVRAPSAEELFANGPHIATQSFEIGNPNFTVEKSHGLEGFVKGKAGAIKFNLSGFIQWFDDYIFDVPTGEEVDDLPVFQILQDDARYYGFEAELAAELLETDGFSLSGDLIVDYVRAQLTGEDKINVPRIPPLRILTGIDGEKGSFSGRLELEHSFAQTDVSAIESPSENFTLLNASLSWHPFGTAEETLITLSANNIFDVAARRHASFTKDFAPLAGRDFRINARMSF